MADSGARILDMRDPAEYARAGTVLDRAQPILIVAEPGREEEAALRLGRIGFDHVKGYLQGGVEALSQNQDISSPTERLEAWTIAEELSSSAPPVVLDVRNPREWAARHIDGSLNVPLNHLGTYRGNSA